MKFTREQDELASAIRRLCGPTLQIDPCDGIYPGAVIVRSGYGKGSAKKIEEAGYRVAPSGRFACIVEPPRQEEETGGD